MDPRHEERLFDRAVAHWNARDFHPAHEDWEDLWHEAEGTRRDWLQGLIQFAAAFFHFERGFHATGFSKLVRSAAERVAGHDASRERIRFDLLRADLAPWIEHGRLVEAGRPLREGAPPLPVIRYRDGVVADPLPFEPAPPPD
jgi:hypothetical protein